MKRRIGIDLKRREFLKTSAGLCAPAALAPLAGLFALSTPARALGLEPWVGPWADPASLVAGIACGTVGVRSLDESLPAYLNGLGYVAHWKGEVPAKLAEFWAVPAMAGKPAAVVGSPQPHSGLIRLIELGNDFLLPTERPTLGWRALEIRTLDVDSMPAQVAGTAISHTGGPADLKFGPPPAAFRAAQFKGPSGEPLIFTEDLVFDRTPIMGGSNVGGIFLQTLVASPYLPTRDLYLKSLVMQLSLEIRMPRVPAEEALGVGDKAMYRMSSIRATWYSTLQVDEYPAEVAPRPRSPGCFPSGVCMSSLVVRDLDRVEEVLQQVGLPFKRLDSNAVPPVFEGRSLACVGFSGEHIEFIESKALSA